VLLDRCTIMKQIGKGTFAMLVLAKEKMTGKLVASACGAGGTFGHNCGKYASSDGHTSQA
jgi:hypothetical protein